MAALTVASSATVEATRTMDMVKKTAASSNSASVASDEAGAAEEQSIGRGMFLTFSSYSGDRRSSLSVERADNVLERKRERTRDNE
jgi:hypothetical protein